MTLSFEAIVTVAAVLAMGVLALLVLVGVRRQGGLIEQAERRQREQDELVRRDIAALAQGLRWEIGTTAREAVESGHERLREATAANTALREALGERFVAFAGEFAGHQEKLRDRVGAGLEEIRVLTETRLEQMRAAVDERLQSALEKRIGESFQRVAEQFASVQQAIGQVQGVAGEIGSLRRLFDNVKARGGWGEAQLRTLLDDVLPPGAYEANLRLGEGEVVEFALRMPQRDASEPVYLPIDAKFPTEDYERLLAAAEAGDREGETQARRGLERAIREQGRRIARYVHPPLTADHAVMYLPSEGLFGEVARIPGLMDALRRESGVYVVGPALLPALLQMIRMGHLSLALERKAGAIGHTLAAVKTEWMALGGALEKLARKAEEMSGSIERTRLRSRAVGRALRGVDGIEVAQAAAVLGVEEDEGEADALAPGAGPLSGPGPQGEGAPK